MIGLEKGKVTLLPHDTEWETEAKNTVEILKAILGDSVADVQHVGSTSIPTIMAKPIIDIAVAAKSFEDVLQHENTLREAGFFYRPSVHIDNQLLFAKGSYYEGAGKLQSHFIHVVLENSMEWINYINFRDFLIKRYDLAKEYESLKLSLAKENRESGGREKYLEGKRYFISYVLRKALVDYYLEKTVRIEMDRPIGSPHPKRKEIIYPINYGYIPNVFGGDGEELDVYLLGVDVPVKEYTAKIIAVVHRHNDIEDKLVAAPDGMFFTKEEIAKSIFFQEKYYDSEIEIQGNKIN